MILAVNGTGTGSDNALSCQEYAELWHCHNQGKATITIDVGGSGGGSGGSGGGMPAVSVHTDSSLTAGVTEACANVSASADADATSSSKRHQVVEAGRHKLAVSVAVLLSRVVDGMR
jgi:hypothetical protein